MDIKEAKKIGKETRRENEYTKQAKIGLEQDFFNRTATVCAKCGRTTLLSLDHIVPRQLLSMLGRDTEREYDEENLQVLCRPCNTFKANNLDFANPRTKPLLLRYLQEL